MLNSVFILRLSIIKRLVGKYKWFSRGISLTIFGNTAGIYSNFLSRPQVNEKKLIFNWTSYLKKNNLQYWIDKIYLPIITSKVSKPESLLFVPGIKTLEHKTVLNGQRMHFFSEDREYCNLLFNYLLEKKIKNFFTPHKFIPFRIDFWRNFPHNAQNESYSDYWHYDRYGCNVFSLFINLGETTSLQGPFHYISYKDSLKESEKINPFNLDEHRIAPNNLKTNPELRTHEGKFNALGICNDKILHRASKVKKGYRDMLRLTFRLIY